MRVSFHEVAQCREKFFIEDEAVTAGMGGNDRYTFLQCRLESVWVSDGLVFSNQAELIPDVTQERQLSFREGSVERFVARISRVELLRIWQNLHQDSAGIGATMHFFDCIPSLWV